MPIGANQTYHFGPFELDTQCAQLRRDGVGLKLQGQPVQILEVLLEKPGQLVSREELRQRLWASDTFVDFDHSLNAAIKRLRQAIGDDADTPRYIETLPKRGYRFIGEVGREETKEKACGVEVAVLPIGQLERRPSIRMPGWRWVVFSSALALLVIACGVTVNSALKPEPQPTIVGTHVLTKTGNLKNVYRRPVIDRGSIYFSEKTQSGWVLSSVPHEGGEVTPGPSVEGELSDISRDGSQVLSVMPGPKNSEDVWIQSESSSVPRLIARDAGDAIWSADGRNIFFRSSDLTKLYRANADGTGVERLATLAAGSGPMHLSPDGSHIRFTGGIPELTLWEIGVDGRNLHHLLGGRKDVYGGSWSADGKHYFFRSWDGARWSLWTISETRRWWSRSAGSEPYPLTFGPMSFGVPAISNDGTQLYAVGKEPRGELSVYDSNARKFAPYLGGISACYVDFSRDGQWIAYVSYPEGTLWRSRIDGSNRRQLTVQPLAVINPRWSPDGKRIAFTDVSNGDRLKMTEGGPLRIYIVGADGGGPQLLLADYFYDPTWSPDGNSIAYGYGPLPSGPGSEVRILDLQTEKSNPVPESQAMSSPRWSPDGKYLAALVGSLGGKKLVLFNFASNTWEELATGEGFAWPSWSRDSKFVYAQDGDCLVRIAIADHKKKQIASVHGFRGTAYYLDKWSVGWFGVTPDGRLLTTRDTGIEELYAFDLEYK